MIEFGGIRVEIHMVVVYYLAVFALWTAVLSKLRVNNAQLRHHARDEKMQAAWQHNAAPAEVKEKNL